MNLVNKILAHPKTKHLSIDDPRTTLVRREIIHSKTFLRAIYTEWYKKILEAISKAENVLELGSGAGFLRALLPTVFTSEVFQVPGVDLIADACHLPFVNQSLNSIVMTDVFHHIPNVDLFFQESTRCIKPNGTMVMIEPWLTPWSKWVYTRLHSEPFEPNADWSFPKTGPLSGANGALPWIVFERDRAIFEKRYPQWRIKKIELMMPFSYLLSGGVSMRSLMPGFMYTFVRKIEQLLNQNHWAMFAIIVLECEGAK